MSRLIVNADDLGYTFGVNRAVFELYKAGAVSSATAMARGAALEGSLATGPPGLHIGCHIVLVDGLASAEPGMVSSLTRGHGFRTTLERFLFDLQRGAVRDREIELEAVAQIRALGGKGLQLTHIDTHKHTHMFPRVLRPLLRAAAQCGITALRNPFEPEWARATVTGASLVRRAETKLLSFYRARFLREVALAGMRTTAGVLGVLATGTLDASTLERLLQALADHGRPEECYELVCHPGYVDVELLAARTRLKAEREREREALGAVVPRWCGPDGPHRLVSFADV